MQNAPICEPPTYHGQYMKEVVAEVHLKILGPKILSYSFSQ